MLRHLLIPLAALSGLAASPALAWDASKAGRYGGLDLDSLDVGGQALLRGGLRTAAPSTLGGTLTLGDDVVPVLPLYNAPRDHYIVMSPGGARVSVKSLGGHDTYGKYGPDSIRTQASFRATSQADAGIEETTMLIEHRGVTGYSPPWYPNYSYPAGTQITGGNGYIFETQSACTTATAKPTASTPAGPNPPQTDGTCTWRYVGIGAGNNKTPLLIYGSIEAPDPSKGRAGGGQGWAEALIMDVQSGAWPQGGGFAVGQEIDVGNGKGECPPAIQNGCQIYGSFINGNGLYRSTVGTFYGGDKGFHVGILLSPTAASSIGISNGSNAQTGYFDNGTHTIASFLDRSTSGYAIKLEGTYATGQIAGPGWGVSAGGGLSASSISTPNAVFASLFAAAGSGPVQLSTANGIGFTVQDAGAAAANIVSVQPGSAGNAASLSVLGTDTNASLAILAKGTGVIALRAPLVAPNLATTGGTVRGTLCVDTTGAVYVKTSSGACL